MTGKPAAVEENSPRRRFRAFIGLPSKSLVKPMARFRHWMKMPTGGDVPKMNGGDAAVLRKNSLIGFSRRHAE